MTTEINLNTLFLKHPVNNQEMPLNHPLTLLEAPLKHLWNKYETIM